MSARDDGMSTHGHSKALIPGRAARRQSSERPRTAASEGALSALGEAGRRRKGAAVSMGDASVSARATPLARRAGRRFNR